jgi:hypothetical protein
LLIEVHLVDIGYIDARLKDIGDPKIGPHVWALVSTGLAHLSKHDFPGLPNRGPCPSGKKPVRRGFDLGSIIQPGEEVELI